jgi:hypothetical protein
LLNGELALKLVPRIGAKQTKVGLDILEGHYLAGQIVGVLLTRSLLKHILAQPLKVARQARGRTLDYITGIGRRVSLLRVSNGE